MKKFVFGGIFGAALAFYFDPDRGTRRRNHTRDRARATTRRLVRRSMALARDLRSRVYGRVQEVIPHQRDNPNPDDYTLRDRIESELFRSQDFPKGDVNINVAEGVVELRGQMDSQTQIDTTIANVRKIAGVTTIHSYLHTPGTPAPNKAEAMRVSTA